MEETNGKSEKIGELRGELRSLVRELQEMRIEQKEMRGEQRKRCDFCQQKMSELTAQWSTHISGHEEERSKSRWSSEMRIMALGIFLSFAASIVSLIQSWG